MTAVFFGLSFIGASPLCCYFTFFYKKNIQNFVLKGKYVYEPSCYFP
jgi:hypothetical protein